MIIGAFAKAELRMRKNAGCFFAACRAFGLRHFVSHRHRASHRHARTTAIRKKSKRRLSPYFRLAHHVGENLDRRTRALLSTKTEDSDDRQPGKKKNEKEAA